MPWSASCAPGWTASGPAPAKPSWPHRCSEPSSGWGPRHGHRPRRRAGRRRLGAVLRWLVGGATTVPRARLPVPPRLDPRSHLQGLAPGPAPPAPRPGRLGPGDGFGGRLEEVAGVLGHHFAMGGEAGRAAPLPGAGRRPGCLGLRQRRGRHRLTATPSASGRTTEPDLQWCLQDRAGRRSAGNWPKCSLGPAATLRPVRRWKKL